MFWNSLKERRGSWIFSSGLNKRQLLMYWPMKISMFVKYKNRDKKYFFPQKVKTARNNNLFGFD